MFCFLKDNQPPINSKVQWRYINLLLIELDSGAHEWHFQRYGITWPIECSVSVGLVLRQTKCPLCDFVPLTVTAAVITEQMKFTFHKDSRIVSWVMPNNAQRVQIQLWLDEDFFAFMGCILHTRRMQSRPPKDWMFQMEYCVTGFSRLLREVSTPSFNIGAIRAGQPKAENIAPDAKCWCFRSTTSAECDTSDAQKVEED